MTEHPDASKSAPNPPQPTTEPGHTPVLLQQTIDILDPQPGQTAVDCTTGRAGHAIEIARQLEHDSNLILADADQQNLTFATSRIQAAIPETQRPKLHPIHANFADLPRLLTQQRLPVDLVLADLGFASTHMDNPQRGFAFKHEGPLDMRYDTRQPRTAREIVNTWSEQDLADIIHDFGEDRAARRIAAAIVHERSARPINTTTHLARIVRSAIPGASRRQHLRKRTNRHDTAPNIDPATKTFQAIRIAVNDELSALNALLEAIARAASVLGAANAHSTPQPSPQPSQHPQPTPNPQPQTSQQTRQLWLNPGARIAIITFHSLEDRAVKRAFADITNRELATHITRRPLAPTPQEIALNPRARSAKLRAIQLRGRPAPKHPIHS